MTGLAARSVCRHVTRMSRAAGRPRHRSGVLYAEWYVAYTSSNKSTYKYLFYTRVGNTLYSPMGNNTEYLRGYAFVVGDGSGNIYNEGGY